MAYTLDRDSRKVPLTRFLGKAAAEASSLERERLAA